MTKKIKIGVLISVVVFFISCDYIINPVLPRKVVTSNDSSVIYKNVMVEDYTGAACGNCPPAASELDTLIALYGSRIVPISVNAGPSFAVPQPTYTQNLQCSVADAYDAFFNMSNTGNPCGMVNRKGTPLSSKYLLFAQWPSITQSIVLQDTAYIKLSVTINKFDTASRSLNITVTSQFLKALSGAYNLVVLLTQDSIIGPQKSGTSGVLHTYAHRFVLRDAINSTWGDTLVTNGSSLNQTITKTYTYNVNTSYPPTGTTSNQMGVPATPCNFKHCSVVAYVYNATTNSTAQYEVLQSQQKKIYP